MTLDDVYGADADVFPLEQDATNWEEIELEWDDTDAVEIANKLAQRESGH